MFLVLIDYPCLCELSLFFKLCSKLSRCLFVLKTFYTLPRSVSGLVVDIPKLRLPANGFTALTPNPA